MMVVVGALRRELEPFRRLIESPQDDRVDNMVFTEGRADGVPVALVQFGIGRERAQAAVRAAVERYRPRLIVSAGFSGGLSTDIEGGDLVLAQQIFAVERPVNGSQPNDMPPIAIDRGLLDACAITLEEGLMRYTVGNIVSVQQAMPSPREKDRLSRTTPALLVDMESYWIAEAARQAGVPFLAARVASDELGDTLPDFERFLDEMGGLRPLKAAWYFLTHPHHLLGAPALALNASRGVHNLEAFGSLLFTMSYRPMAYRPVPAGS